MNQNEYTSFRRNTRYIAIGCSVFFLVFSFMYLYFLQGNLMEATHFSFAHGKTSYSPFWGAILITLVLFLLHKGLQFLLRLKGRWTAASYFLNRTRQGLQLRAVGENPATADAAGINVGRYKYWATIIGSMIAGLGGLYYVMDYASGVWSNDAFGDRGWLAIALVIFTIWRPNVSILASLLFGGLYILYLYIPTGTNMAIKEIYKMAPFVVTIIVLIIISMRKKRENQPPAHLGLPYFREER